MDTSKEMLQRTIDPRVIACELAKAQAGGYAKLAAKLGVKRQVVYGWKMVPATWALKVEQETGISVHHMRPDVFGPPPVGSEAAATADGPPVTA